PRPSIVPKKFFVKLFIKKVCANAVRRTEAIKFPVNHQTYVINKNLTNSKAVVLCKNFIAISFQICYNEYIFSAM
ncbi:MAG: hypothetical protein ACI4JM_09455, partial [Oscillospiraceae bacterium]